MTDMLSAASASAASPLRPLLPPARHSAELFSREERKSIICLPPPLANPAQLAQRSQLGTGPRRGEAGRGRRRTPCSKLFAIRLQTSKASSRHRPPVSYPISACGEGQCLPFAKGPITELGAVECKVVRGLVRNGAAWHHVFAYFPGTQESTWFQLR